MRERRGTKKREECMCQLIIRSRVGEAYIARGLASFLGLLPPSYTMRMHPICCEGRKGLGDFLGVRTVGAVGAIAPPLFSEELALFQRADIKLYSPVSRPAPFLAHARTGRKTQRALDRSHACVIGANPNS